MERAATGLDGNSRASSARAAQFCAKDLATATVALRSVSLDARVVRERSTP